MRILAIHKRHDGAVATIEDGQLVRYFEAQKDNYPRHSELRSEQLDCAVLGMELEPDIVAIAGWTGQDGGYFGCDSSVIRTSVLSIEGHQVEAFATSHERTHIFCAYGMSPFEQGRACYVLVWEGSIGAFYSIDEDCEITCLAKPMSEPGHRYAFLYELAHPDFPPHSRGFSYNVAGKLMALASQADSIPLSSAEQSLMNTLLNDYDFSSLDKQALRQMPFWNAGCLNEGFRRFAYRFSSLLFDRFYSVAKAVLKDRRPLLIAGGCGLNCDWNTRWRDSNLFDDVFVPPCADDSGCAIGAGVDAQRYFTGNAKLQWNVYAGEEFISDIPVPTIFQSSELNYDKVVQLLLDGAVVAWVQGRYEIGPRALGNRSLLASPFTVETKDRLNWIKKRENYRPVAPVCLEDEVSKWFRWHAASPYMLYFQSVKDSRIQAVTHDDRTARVQTVKAEENERLYKLLCSFSQRSGVGVLCNTSLNFPGRGFINRTSDLVDLVLFRKIEVMVINDKLYTLHPDPQH